MNFVFRFAAIAAAFALPVAAQNAISARAGMINVADGDVYIVDGKGGEPQRVEPKPSELIEVKEGQILRTAEGRSEVLLTPGAFLRMGEESSFKLIGNRLSDVRLDVLTGSVLVEVVELLEGNSLTILTKDATASVVKPGIYRFDAEPGRVRVYQGEVKVEIAGVPQTLKGSRELVAAAGSWSPAKFDDKEGDPLFRWAKRRSGYIAMANVSAARTAKDSFSCGSRCGMWAFNPYFGFATYLPYRDTLRNPFGFYFYTPYSVMAVFAPRPVYAPSYGGGGGGYDGGWVRGAYSGGASSLPSRSYGGGYSGGSVASAPAASAPAASAPVRGGESAGARGGSSAGGRGQ